MSGERKMHLTNDELAVFRLAKWAIANNDRLALSYIASLHIPRYAREAARRLNNPR
jgi:hypothetical protein